MIQSKEAYEFATLAKRLYDMCMRSYADGSPWNEAQFLSDLENEHSRYFLLEEEKQLLGFISCHQVFGEVEILHVVVEKVHKGRGIGQELLTALFDEAQASEQEKIFLEVRESNEIAQSLYQKNGFERLAKRKNYYHAPLEDAWVMVKEVRSTKEE